MSMAVVAVGQTLGTTTINLGTAGSLVLGLDMPFVPLPLGQVGISGSASATIAIPSALAVGVDLHAQAVVLGLTIGQGRPSLTAC
ncbi:MAG: hypothetical protein RL398_2209 [Planctomycetota bacterium]